VAFWETNFVIGYVIAILLLINFPITLLKTLPTNISLGNLNSFELYKVAAVLLIYSLFCALLPVARREQERRIKIKKENYVKKGNSDLPFDLSYISYGNVYKRGHVFLLYLIPVSLLLIRFDPIGTYYTLLPFTLASLFAATIIRYIIYIILSLFIIIPVTYRLLVILCLWIRDSVLSFNNCISKLA